MLFGVSPSYYFSWLLKLAVGLGLFTIITVFWRRWRGKNFVGRGHKPMPPEFWFYTVLIDIEVGQKDTNQLYPLYLDYLTRRYQGNLPVKDITKLRETLDTIEPNPKTLAFQKTLLTELDLLKQKPAEQVIEYVQQIKFNFNKGDLSAWLAQRAANNDCNNC